MSYRYVIDSSMWFEYLRGTAQGMKIRAIIENESIATSIIAIAELADKCGRENIPFGDKLKFIQSRSAILPLTVSIALSAAKTKKRLRVQNPKFGLADAIHLATAKQEQALLVTADNDFAGEEGIVLV